MQFHYLRCRQCTSPGCEVVRFTHQAIVVSGIETQTFRESSGGFQSCVWRQGQSENKNHQHPSQCSSHLQKKKNARYFEKNYLTWPPTAPHLWSRCQHGFLLHFSLHLYTERIDSWLQWVSGTAGSGDGISGWFSGISRSCMYFCWSPSLVPLFPCQNYIWQESKKDGCFKK